MAQRAPITSISENGVVTLGRDGGGSYGQRGRLIVRSGGQVVFEPISKDQSQALEEQIVQGLAPGEVPQVPPPAPGHALSPPEGETKEAPEEPSGPPLKVGETASPTAEELSALKDAGAFEGAAPDKEEKSSEVEEKASHLA